MLDQGLLVGGQARVKNLTGILDDFDGKGEDVFVVDDDDAKDVVVDDDEDDGDVPPRH